MDKTDPSEYKPTPMQTNIVNIWHRGRDPRIGIILGIILSLLIVLLLVLPQETGFVSLSQVTAEASWLAALPNWLKPLGSTLYQLRFSRILQSGWFWIPAAGLLFHSLLAFADYGRYARRRWLYRVPGLSWQYPFTLRAEASVRLPYTPEDALRECQGWLEQQGFMCHEAKKTAQRVIGATRWRWAWWGRPLLYAGVSLLLFAFAGTSLFMTRERIVPSMLEIERSRLLAGQVEVIEVDPNQGVGEINFSPNGTSEQRSLIWQQAWPSFFAGSLIFVREVEPLLTVEIRDAAGVPLELVPLQQRLTTETEIVVPLEEAIDSPVLFSTRSSPLAFQIASVDGNTPNQFNVQVQYGDEATPLRDLQVTLGEIIEIEGLSGTITLNYEMLVLLYRDPFLVLYPLAFVLIIIGIITLWRPPSQVWLIPEIKGRGGQLYAVIETHGKEESLKQFLAELLDVVNAKAEDTAKAEDVGKPED